jgi:adenylate cyclase
MGTRTADIWKATSDALLGKPELRGSEVTAQAGVPAIVTSRFWQALGFPTVPGDEPAFTKRDVEIMAFAARLIDGDSGPDRELLLRMARATGQSLSRIAHMHVLSIVGELETAARSSELSNSEAADRIADLAESLVRSHEPFLGFIWRRHLLAAISQIVANAIDNGGENEGTTIGFADVVDFTAVSQQLSEEELAEFVDHFEKIAYQEIPERGGRVIKTLGDEVMFSNASPHAAAETALALAEAFQADDLLPHVRVGLATGSMLAWEGDLYGPTVNLAHRLVSVARPGTVIVSDDLAERLDGDDAFALVEIRDVKLKGIGRTKPWVLRRRGATKS